MRGRILIPKICVRSRPTPRRPRRERLPVANPSQTISPLNPYEFTYMRDSKYIIWNIRGQKHISEKGGMWNSSLSLPLASAGNGKVDFGAGI